MQQELNSASSLPRPHRLASHLLRDLPHRPVADGAAILGCAEERALRVLDEATVGIFPVCPIEAMQQGEPATLAYFVHRSYVGRAAGFSIAAKVAGRVHNYTR
jgi:hypothetical protein